uniref:AlNc14C525G12045 protein n=1 Tax=Albugo laibachii Nc14 TaxID=890382 RepID=F0X0V5_9STRA|nr:AlNc14C525G12045 [Albugo laibachii Nc14]|eukprot:CCA27400.1 AlNc14C525G12045 [Albugo laibachii Nc14]
MLYMNWTFGLLTIAAIRHVLTIRAVEDVKSWYGRYGRDTGEADREPAFSRSKECYICFTAAQLNSRPYAKLRMVRDTYNQHFFFGRPNSISVKIQILIG